MATRPREWLSVTSPSWPSGWREANSTCYIAAAFALWLPVQLCPQSLLPSASLVCFRAVRTRPTQLPLGKELDMDGGQVWQLTSRLSASLKDPDTVLAQNFALSRRHALLDFCHSQFSRSL